MQIVVRVPGLDGIAVEISPPGERGEQRVHKQRQLRAAGRVGGMADDADDLSQAVGHADDGGDCAALSVAEFGNHFHSLTGYQRWIVQDVEAARQPRPGHWGFRLHDVEPALVGEGVIPQKLDRRIEVDRAFG